MTVFRLIICLVIVVLSTAGAAAADPGSSAHARAERLLLTGRYAEAAVGFRAFADDAPVAAALGLARCQQARGQYDASRQTLKAALAAHPEAADLAVELARLALGQGDHEQAEVLVAQARASQADHVIALWLMAELDRVHGRIEAAEQHYQQLADRYDEFAEAGDLVGLHHVGLATAQLARWRGESRPFRFLVTRLYPQILDLDRYYWPAHLETARLLLEKYNEPDALVELNAGLAINGQSAELHTLRAQLALERRSLDDAARHVERALQINPRCAVAYQIRADIAMARRDPAAALASLERARVENPIDPGTLGRLAAAHLAQPHGDSQDGIERAQQIIQQATAQNPHCGEMFVTLADSLARMARFSAAVSNYQEARQRMPQLGKADAELGLLYMRLGLEEEALPLLTAAFASDPYNVRVKNTLEVLDLLSGYAVLETDHFILRFDRGRDERLATFMAHYLEDVVYPETVAAMGFEPPEKTLLEIFNEARSTSGHGWFSARVVGVPHIGAVGACAGHMMAMVSPDALPQAFNWSRVLRHEYVHVVNLQQTDFKVPHWFTEGLAVYLERDARPSAWNALLLRRAEAGLLYDLSTIDEGFLAPRTQEDWTLAYCQAELYMEHLEQTYGEDSLRRMLTAYANGFDTAAALQRCFDVDQHEFEQTYQELIERIVAPWREAPSVVPERTLGETQAALKLSPEDPALQAELAWHFLQRGDHPQARHWSGAALGRASREPLASYVAARLHLHDGQPQQALDQLTAALNEQAPQPELLNLLAELYLRQRQFTEAEQHYRRGARLYSYSDAWLKGLARLYVLQQRDDLLAEVLSQLAADDVDNATYRKKLAQLALARQDFEAAKSWATAALHIDVQDVQSRLLLAQALRASGAVTEAAEQEEIAAEGATDSER